MGQTTKDGLFSLETVACLGCCSIAPAMMVNGKFFGRLDKKKLEALIEKWRASGRVERMSKVFIGMGTCGLATGAGEVKTAVEKWASAHGAKVEITADRLHRLLQGGADHGRRHGLRPPRLLQQRHP